MQVFTSFHSIVEILNQSLHEGKTPHGSIIVSGRGPRIAQILEMAQRLRLKVAQVTAADIDNYAQDHRGIALLLDESAVRESKDMLGYLKSLQGNCLALVLDHIEDPHNLGAIVRNGDCFGASFVVLPAARSAALAEGAMRASAGALAHMKIFVVPNLVAALGLLSDNGFATIALDMEGKNIRNHDSYSRVALVLGGEEKGVSRLVKEKCDYAVSIPMRGEIDSLNVASASAVALYEFSRTLETAAQEPTQ